MATLDTNPLQLATDHPQHSTPVPHFPSTSLLFYCYYCSFLLFYYKHLANFFCNVGIATLIDGLLQCRITSLSQLQEMDVGQTARGSFTPLYNPSMAT